MIPVIDREEALKQFREYISKRMETVIKHNKEFPDTPHYKILTDRAESSPFVRKQIETIMAESLCDMLPTVAQSELAVSMDVAVWILLSHGFHMSDKYAALLTMGD